MINLVKKLKSVIAVIVLSLGTLIATQAHAYTIHDYNNTVAQFNDANVALSAAYETSSANYYAAQGEYNVYIINLTRCSGDESSWRDCTEGYRLEYEANMATYQQNMMAAEAEVIFWSDQISYLTQLRDTIAAALGL